MKKTRHDNRGLRKVCGCARRAWAGCPHSWYFSFKWAGTHHRLSLDRHFGEHVDSKTLAEEKAGDLRKAIRAGTFGQVAPREDMNLRQLADLYLERYVDVDHAATAAEFRYSLGTICRTIVPRPTGGSAPLGDWRVDDLVTDTVNRLREVRLSQGTGAVGVNRNVRRLRALFTWGITAGYVTRTPFKLNGEPVVKLTKELPRSRRLQANEEAPLLAACSPPLRALVEAALATGCRKGELLSMQWSQVEGMQLKESDGKWSIVWAPKAELFLPKEKTKTQKDRRVPISTRLKAILEMRRFDPAGQPHPLDAYAFGTEIGTRVTGFKRAWNTAVLKAHGTTPVYTKTKNLDAASRSAMAAIGLHFHDLRREAASRWMDAGTPLATIQRWLGHSSIAQTSVYLSGSMDVEHDAMAKFEAHQNRLQQFATKAETGGRKRPRTATRRNERPSKTAVRRDTPIM